MAGAQLLSVDYADGGRFVRDPSQIVTATKCPREQWLTIEDSLKLFPREAFDYVCLIDPPSSDPALAQGLEEVWRSGTSVVYRVVDRSAPLSASNSDERSGGQEVVVTGRTRGAP